MTYCYFTFIVFVRYGDVAICLCIASGQGWLSLLASWRYIVNDNVHVSSYWLLSLFNWCVTVA